jgi:hypothetical protein
MVLEHDPLHQADHQPVFESPNYLIGIVVCSKPLCGGGSGQKEREGKKVYETGTTPAHYATAPRKLTMFTRSQ